MKKFLVVVVLIAMVALARVLLGDITVLTARLPRVLSEWQDVAWLLVFPVLLSLLALLKPNRILAITSLWTKVIIAALALLPFSLLYLLFGDWLNAATSWIPGIFRLILPIVMFVVVYRYLNRLLSRLFQRKAQPRIGLHGSAHWAITAEATARGHYQKMGYVLADSYGFALGRSPEPMAGMDTRFRYMGHMLTCAPTGSGKGIGAVIPNLLEYPGSCVVLDIKGENYAVTSRYRRDVLGHDVWLLDPFGVTRNRSHGLNWLDRLDPDSPDVVGESTALADMLVMADSHASGDSIHFNETAKTFLRGVMVHVATLPDDRRHMGEVRRLLTGNMDEFAELLLAMEKPARRRHSGTGGQFPAGDAGKRTGIDPVHRAPSPRLSG